MALKRSETSCIFRQVPLERTDRRMPGRPVRVANDNFLREVSSVEVEEENLSAADIASTLAVIGVLGLTFYVLVFSVTDILHSLPIFYP